MKLAAIDIGSNSAKIVVVDAASSDSFTVLASQREVVRLGQETLINNHIGTAATLRALDCLKRFRALAEQWGAEKIVATATASVREANNAAEFLQQVERETGVRIEVVSGLEEARLIGLAASQGCTPKGVVNLNIDIGGGSTEISIFRDSDAIVLRSIKLGAVGLTDRFIHSDPPAANELHELQTHISAALKDPVSELREHKWDDATATSGTAMAIGSALNHVAPYTKSTITLVDLKRLNTTLSTLMIDERRKIEGLSPQRADIIVAGGLVMEEVMSALEIESLTTCEWSLREGVIIDRLREWEQSSGTVLRSAGEQIESVG